MIDSKINLNLGHLDWEKLKNPSPLFKAFQPTPEKIKKLSTALMTVNFFLPDENRNWTNIQQIIQNFMNPYRAKVFYEAGDFSGLVGFINIIPHYKADFMWKIWDYDKVWSKTFVRETKELIDLIINTFKLKRLEFLSGDEKAIKMGKIAGFEVEGIKKNDFLHRGKFYDSYILAKYGG